MSDPVDVILNIGNTYRCISRRNAEFDKSGSLKKIHDWTLYVDIDVESSSIIENFEGALDRVTFDLGSTFQGNPFVCYSPIPLKNGSVWRFHTRQQSYGAITANILVRGAGGMLQNYEHRIEFNNRNECSYNFMESRAPRPLKVRAMPELQFGVELECTTSYSLDEIVAAMPVDCELIEAYSQGQATSERWKLVPDSSIACNLNNPNCNTFEIVSPILYGGKNGLSQINKICRALKSQDIKINKSAGFHVHIDVEDYSLKQLIKICQQFIKYEEVFDTFMPPSRRSGSLESDRYFKSNRDAIGKFYTNKQRNEMLADCTSTMELVSLMNGPGADRYYKLNLQNLRTGRQPTIEFRQHSATMNYEKISSWVRLCAHFCTSAARLAPPSPFQQGKHMDDQFQSLFWYVVKDRALRDKYKERQSHLLDEEDSCCSGCANGSSCNSKRIRMF